MSCAKKALKTARCRRLITFLQDSYRVSDRRACAVIQMGRSNYSYKSRKHDDPALRFRICEIAKDRVRYGYQRIHTLLQREG